MVKFLKVPTKAAHIAAPKVGPNWSESKLTRWASSSSSSSSFNTGGKVVVVTNGRYAGKKAVIVKCNDEGTNARPYGHALVCGLRTVPRKITRKMDQKKQDKRSRCKTFIKYINLNHLMPTRYSLDVDLKGVVTPDVLDDATKKVAAQKESKKLFEEKFKTGKNRWFFTRLAF